MNLGIPAEIMEEENRVAALPQTVKKYMEMGFKVLVESDAGKGVFIDNSDYENAGAEIIDNAATLYEKSDIILKVKQPEYNKKIQNHEIEMMNKDSTLITFLHPAAPSSHANIQMLKDKGITSFTMDGIPRITRAQSMDALTSMSTVTGYRSVLMASNLLQKFIPMIGTAIGTIKPANILIIGAGVVGLQAIATAKRLGGVVKAIDIREEAQKEAASLGAKIIPFDVPAEIAKGSGGYARALPEAWLEKERDIIRENIREVDIIILSALVPGEVAPIIINEDMLKIMMPGSVIIDVSIDQGGNCIATDPGKTATKNNVIICGVQNIPGRVAVHSSWLYANNMLNFVKNLYKDNINTPDMSDEIVKNSLVTYKGEILHQGTLKALGLKN